MTTFLVTGLTLRELARRKLAAAAAVATLIIVAFTAWGLHRLATATVEGVPITEPAVRATTAGIVLLLAFLFSFVVALGAALVGAPAVAESIANGEILALLARPVRRAEVLAGRWLGTIVALTVYVGCAGIAELAVVRVVTGYVPPDAVSAFGYLAAVAVVVSTASVALGTRLPAMAAAVVAALLFGLAWIGGIVEAVGIALGNERLADAGTVVGLAFPSDAFWRGAVYALQPAVFRTAAATVSASAQSATVNPFAVASPPPPALIAWSAGWIVVVFALAVLAFRRRDF